MKATNLTPCKARGVHQSRGYKYPLCSDGQGKAPPTPPESRCTVRRLSRPTNSAELLRTKLAAACGVPAMARSSVGLGLACFAVVVVAASATQFRVGGQKGWTVPDAGFEPYNTWAGRLRFQIGDQLRKLLLLLLLLSSSRSHTKTMALDRVLILIVCCNLFVQCSCTPRRRTRCSWWSQRRTTRATPRRT